MSIFDDSNSDVKNAIRFFNQLLEEEKIKILSDLNPNTFKSRRYYKPLLPLLSKIQNDISQYDEIKIGTKLLELGLDETYARLFVSNIKKHAPTQEYQCSQVNKIPDDLFCDNLSEIMKRLWVNYEEPETITDKYNIPREQLKCIVDLTRLLINGLARGDTTKELIKNEYNNKITERKLDTLVNEVSIYSKHWYDTMLFSNVQEIFFNSDQIVKQNREILRLMKELVESTKSKKQFERQ